MIIKIEVATNEGKLLHCQILDASVAYEYKAPALDPIVDGPLVLLGFKFEPFVVKDPNITGKPPAEQI